MTQAPRKRRFKGTKEPISIRMPTDLYSFLKDQAEARGYPIGDFIVGLLDEDAADLEEQERQEPKSKSRK